MFIELKHDKTGELTNTPIETADVLAISFQFDHSLEEFHPLQDSYKKSKKKK